MLSRILFIFLFIWYGLWSPLSLFWCENVPSIKDNFIYAILASILYIITAVAIEIFEKDSHNFDKIYNKLVPFIWLVQVSWVSGPLQYERLCGGNGSAYIDGRNWTQRFVQLAIDDEGWNLQFFGKKILVPLRLDRCHGNEATYPV